ncbi:MAG: transporter domain protein, partial [Polaromonas sp.]|nr:transporter domain protein [Polaromonas sp.]
RFSAGVERLHAFSQALDAEAGPPAGALGESAQQMIHTVHGFELALERLTVLTPRHEHLLLQEVTLTVSPGQGLLIVGPSGTGKSSLLRVIAGLWDTGSGQISRPAASDMLFLPQQPYLPLGDLRCQLTYPHTERDISEEELLHWLALVNLPTLAERFGGFGAELDWARVLSVGEQQRLAFARALIARPRYLLLDESTSALDAANEQQLYGQLAGLSITPVSVSHHASVLKYHHRVLALPGDGSWLLHEAAGYRWAP